MRSRVNKTLYAAAFVSALSIIGCSTKSTMTSVEYLSQENGPAYTVTETAPGVVKYTWEEPIVDVVTVPPGLDPEGHYYRPAHEEIREIRQGRWIYRGEQ